MMKKTKEEAIEIERNWVDLLPELFPLILVKLPDIYDFVRCRTVCKPWHLSSSLADLPPQFPWILRNSHGPDLEFYSMAFNKVYTVHTRCSSGKSLFRPVGGYLLTGQKGNADSFSLLNPLNYSKVPLPVLHDLNPNRFPENFARFSPLSFPSDNYVVAIDYDASVGCKLGDDRWDIIGPGHECKYRCYYFQGLLFRVGIYTWVTAIIDTSSRKELYVIPPPKYELMINMSFRGPYLVESCGEILTVCYNQSYEWTDYKFYIHRLEFGNGKGNSCWVKLSSIGDRILFFDFSVGAGRGFCLTASDFRGFKGNCIYFINRVRGCQYVINMYDMENGETVLIDTPFNRNIPIAWFMPTLNHI